MIGRWLCRIGMHRWGFGCATDPRSEVGDAEPRYTVVTYAWCRRKTCCQPTQIVNVETR